MGKIVISRKQEWINRMRQIGIYVDGQKMGTIANGETKSFEIPDGNHSVKAKIDWCGSRELDFFISGEEKKYFQLSGYKYSNLVIYAAIVIFVLHFLASNFWKFYLVAWLYLPLFLIILYYISFGRKDYLRLKQTESW